MESLANAYADLALENHQLKQKIENLEHKEENLSDDGEINEDDFELHSNIQGIAKMALTCFRALKRDGASDTEAMIVTASFITGMTKAGIESEADE